MPRLRPTHVVCVVMRPVVHPHIGCSRGMRLVLMQCVWPCAPHALLLPEVVVFELVAASAGTASKFGPVQGFSQLCFGALSSTGPNFLGKVSSGGISTFQQSVCLGASSTRTRSPSLVKPAKIEVNVTTVTTTIVISTRRTVPFYTAC